MSFNYDEAAKEIGPKESSAIQEEETENDDNDDTPFTPSDDLKLPPDMEFPSTIKLNQIIEKTAKFISRQGIQMEILLKTKQSTNSQFNFLNHNSELNAYYKHIMLMMKNSTYPWQVTEDKSNENSNDANDNSNETIETVPPMTSIVIPKIQYKPSKDCHYTMLISKITKAPLSELEKKQEEQFNKAQNNINADVPKVSSGLLGLSNYDSDSDSEDNDDDKDDNYTNGCVKYEGEIPPSEIQIVIDKTAVYVAKNGTDFEQKLVCKQDPRFEFLQKDNKFHLYYKMKVKSYLPSVIQTTTTTPTNNSNNNHNNTNVTTTTATTSLASVDKKKEVKDSEIILPKVPPPPVSFSIKAKEERPPLKVTTTMENSDDEKNCDVLTPQAPSPPRISTTSVEEELERQVDIINADREEKLAKDRLSDKLLNAAREKLGMLPKEKMLQIERKKKLMIFMNQKIKGEIEFSYLCE